MIDQSVIAITGAVAIWLTQDRRKSVQRWACVVGLVGQPFWLFVTWQAAQWGMFMLSVFYTAAWLKGVWIYWGKYSG